MVYRVIGASIIRGVAVTAAISDNRTRYTWSGVLVGVMGWMFGGVGCHEMSKCVELSYKLG